MFEITEETHQRFAVSALIGNCEGLLKSSELNPSQRASLMLCVHHTLEAFGMPTKEELDRSAA